MSVIELGLSDVSVTLEVIYKFYLQHFPVMDMVMLQTMATTDDVFQCTYRVAKG